MVNGVSAIPLGSRPSAAPLAVCVRETPLPDTLQLPSDSFIAGKENRLLASVAGAWCNAMGNPSAKDHANQKKSAAWRRLASPLVLVGTTGSGKSLLVEGLASLADHSVVHCSTANDLRRDFADELERGDPARWRNALTSKQVVAIDDLDHLPVHSGFQQELLHLIDQLDAQGGKLIVTSAQPIAHLRGWIPGLVSRFTAGLTVEISPLGCSARRELLTQLAETCRWKLSPETLNRLVSHSPSEPRELLRLANDLRRQFGDGAQLETRVLDHFLALRRKAHAPNLREIVRVVGRYYRLPLKVLTSGSRKASNVLARATVIYLARTLTAASYEQIGELLGGRDHTTIMHSHRRTENRLSQEPQLRSALDDLTRILGR